MSLHTMIHVHGAATRDPLMKLVLVQAGDQSSEDGRWRWDLKNLVSFCCASEEDVCGAISRLILDGWLEEVDDPNIFRIGGYSPPPPGRPVYQKKEITPGMRKRMFARDGHACKHCGTTEKLTVDHIYPERHGGQHTFENFQTLCMPCNLKKGWRKP